MSNDTWTEIELVPLIFRAVPPVACIETSEVKRPLLEDKQVMDENRPFWIGDVE